MSALATQHNAINLGQGFPDFECDPRLIDAVSEAMRQGHNQYPLMTGVPLLRERVAQKMEAIHGVRYDPQTDVTITSGATQGILSAILAVVGAGDEVIVLEPCYDSYTPNIELAGGVPVPVRLKPESFDVDWDALSAAITKQTRAIIVNSPHNPNLAMTNQLSQTIPIARCPHASTRIVRTIDDDGAYLRRNCR